MPIKQFRERLITFIVLGYFVFVADVASWWQTGSIGDWYSNYLVWVGLIILCYLAASTKSLLERKRDRKHS